MSKIKYATLSLNDDQQHQQQEEQIYQTVLQTNECNNKNVQNIQDRNDFEICSISLDTTNTTTLSSTAITTANSYLNDASFSFINTPVINDDVFTQEANFAVPIMNKTWSTTTTTTTTAQLIDTNSTLTPPIFTVPQNVCIKPTFDDDATTQAWHGSTDLLELDHRYNSCLQTDLLQTDNPSVIVNCTDNQAEALSELNEFMATNGKGILRQEVILTTHKNVQNHFDSELQQQQHQLTRVSSDSESDFEDRNLSWLLNFKFDEFPHLSPDTTKNKMNFNMNHLNINSTTKNLKKSNSCSPSLDASALHMQAQICESGASMSSKKKFEDLVMEATSDMDCTDNIENDNPVLDDVSYRM